MAAGWRPGHPNGYIRSGDIYVANASLHFHGLVLVSGNAGSGNRTGASWRAGAGRPLYLPADGWLALDTGVGRDGCNKAMAARETGRRRGSRGLWCGMHGAHLDTSLLLAEWGDAIPARGREPRGQLLGAVQPRRRAIQIGRAHV